MYHHYNYARWQTKHRFDFYTTKTKFPDVCYFLSKENFSFQRSHRDFSRTGLNQIYEQNNKLIKGCGGASNLLNKVDDSALICLKTCSPKIVLVILQFNCLDRHEILAESSTKHHKDSQPFTLGNWQRQSEMPS